MKGPNFWSTHIPYFFSSYVSSAPISIFHPCGCNLDEIHSNKIYMCVRERAMQMQLEDNERYKKTFFLGKAKKQHFKTEKVHPHILSCAPFIHSSRLRPPTTYPSLSSNSTPLKCHTLMRFTPIQMKPTVDLTWSLGYR